MKKITVILIIVILITSFGLLVWYGLKFSRGVPVVVEKRIRPILEIPFIDRNINLAEGISTEFWQTIDSVEIDLLYQITVLPWPKPREFVWPVSVKAFHNNKDIYFYLTWKDDTEDSTQDIDKFSDACAVMFPLGEENQPSSIMMGFLGKANIWQWKASQDKEFWLKEPPETNAYADFHYPFEEEETLVVSKDEPKSAVNDLLSIRVGTVTPKDIQNVEGRGLWSDGIWYVIFKRSLETVDLESDAKFETGKKRLCAFAVWNGTKGDRGGRKSISDWVELDIK